jgi:hypothetical protein
MTTWETYTVSTGEAGNWDLRRLDEFLNEKCAAGWILISCQFIGNGQYFVVMYTTLEVHGDSNTTV